MAQWKADKVHVIDSHTAGEPTRVVVSGGPPLGDAKLSERLSLLRRHFDSFRSAVVQEPRGSAPVIGALLCQPHDGTCSAGVIFFNSLGYLNTSCHGIISLAVTLAHLRELEHGKHRFETPVGVVEIHLHNDNQVTFYSSPSYRLAKGVRIAVDGFGEVSGDVAWGGDWFFLTNNSPCALELKNVEQLTGHAWNIRQALRNSGLKGADGHEIDHIKIWGHPKTPGCHGRNFVLYPGKDYDRSPCGTGISAKLACLHADGHFKSGETWRQESIIGTIFEGSVVVKNKMLHPRIKGSAWVVAESDLILNRHDPLCWGITRPSSISSGVRQLHSAQ